MAEDKKNMESADPKMEKEEPSGFSWRNILDGSWLAGSSFGKQIPFILFGVLLTLIYIANRYHAEKVIRRIDFLKKEIENLRAEEITTASELMNLNRPSNIQKLVEDRELDLKFPATPPNKIAREK
jgi:hypothetical protein